MKSIFYVLLLSLAISACQPKENAKVLVPRPLTANEDLNQFSGDKKNALAIFQTKDSAINQRADRLPGEVYHVKLGDTAISIQMNAADKNSLISSFSFAEFLNTQKTSLLVQAADSSGLVSPFYILTLSNNKLEAITLYRESNGKQDKLFTKGLGVIGRSAYVINNDYVIKRVAAKIYTIKRQKAEERIQGKFFMNSPDKETIIFLLPNLLYEVHYPTGTVYSQPLPANTPEAPALYKFIQNGYSWQRNESGISFLKKNIDDNRIINIEDF